MAGWTPKTIPLVRELTIANKTRGLKRTIVVLGDKDKEEMDEDMRAALPNSERNGSKVANNFLMYNKVLSPWCRLYAYVYEHDFLCVMSQVVTETAVWNMTNYTTRIFQIVTRSGVPTETEDLRRYSAAMARAIILLSPGGLPSHEADSLVRTYF